MICKECRKNLDENSFHSDGRGGKRTKCKSCVNRKCAEYRIKNLDKVRLKDKRYREANTEKLRLYGRQHYQLNKHSYAESEARRRASKKKATPSWLSKNQKEQIKYLYWLAQDLSKVAEEKYQVDHIVPLQNDYVCGLHVPWNLQILSERDNYAKGNKFNFNS